MACGLLPPLCSYVMLLQWFGVILCYVGHGTMDWFSVVFCWILRARVWYCSTGVVQVLVWYYDNLACGRLVAVKSTSSATATLPPALATAKYTNQ